MRSGRSTYRLLGDATVVVVFLILLAVPLVRGLLGPPPPARTENRVLAPLPELRWQTELLKIFPARFEAYYKDHFGGRLELIRWLHVIQAQWLHLPALAKVAIGKGGWLFYLQKPVGPDDDPDGPFTPAELAHWQRTLEGRRDWLARRGIPYVFVIAPDKQSVYPEAFPGVLRRRAAGGSRLDQLLNHLHAHSDLVVLDLRGPLREAKTRERVYAVTDSHWNTCGAFVAYQYLVEALTPYFPAVRPMARSAFDRRVVPRQGGDLAAMLALDDRLREADLALIPHRPRQARRVDPGVSIPGRPPEMQPEVWEQPDRSLPRAVMFRDSFAGNLVPFLSEHFQRIFYLWQEPYEFDIALIEREHPDLVIQEMVERKLTAPFPPTDRAEPNDAAVAVRLH